MDTKRFILFLVLSWGLLLGWQMWFPQPQVEPTGAVVGETGLGLPPAGPVATPLADTIGQAGEAPAGAAVSSGDEGSKPSLSAPVAPVVEPWSETLELGRAGEPGHYLATFSSLGGTLSELRLDGYYIEQGLSEDDRRQPSNWVALVEPLQTDQARLGSLIMSAGPSARGYLDQHLETAHWDHELIQEDGETTGVRFRFAGRPGGLGIEKIIRHVPGRYELSVELVLVGGEGFSGGGQAEFQFLPAMGMPMASDDAYYIEPRARSCGRNKLNGELLLKSEERSPKPDDFTGSLSSGRFPSFVGVDNKYFAMLLRPADSEIGNSARDAMGSASWRRDYDAAWAQANPDQADEAWRHIAAVQDLRLNMPTAGQRRSYGFTLFAGPKDRDVLETDNPDHLALVRDDLGFFASIAGFLLGVLDMFHGLVGNWGVAIILLTLAVRLALFPFNRRSQTAMARHATKMKRVQPKIDAVKAKYKDNPQKLRQEQARVMQEEGAFPPLGGCAPMFLQIPVFFGLFSALRVSFDLRQADFLWVRDLSMPDRLMRLDFNTHLPFIGTIEWLNVLPPLMVVLWILQQRVMPKPTDPQAAKMQRMMMWMPVLFGFFLYNYAAGLSIYMITTSLFGIMEYTLIRRIWPLDDSEQPKKPKGKLSARWGEMMKEAQKLQAEKERMKAKAQTSKGGRR